MVKVQLAFWERQATNLARRTIPCQETSAKALLAFLGQFHGGILRFEGRSHDEVGAEQRSEASQVIKRPLSGLRPPRWWLRHQPLLGSVAWLWLPGWRCHCCWRACPVQLTIGCLSLSKNINGKFPLRSPKRTFSELNSS